MLSSPGRERPFLDSCQRLSSFVSVCQRRKLASLVQTRPAQTYFLQPPRKIVSYSLLGILVVSNFNFVVSLSLYGDPKLFSLIADF